MLFVILFFTNLNNTAVLKNIIKKRKVEEKQKMFELAKRFLGKECLIYTFNSQLTGTVKEVNAGAVLLENGNSLEAVNFDFIVRIREYPRKKNGKKKSVILD